MNSLAKKFTIKKKVWKQVVQKSVVSFLSVLMAFGQSGLLVLTALTPTAVTAATGPNVVINEVMPNPSSGNEWVELYNAGDAPQDLTGWSVVDENPTTFDATLSTILNPGEYLVLTDTSVLNNSGDSAILKNNAGDVVDSITYTTTEAGKSIGRQQDADASIVVFLPSAVSEGVSNRCEVSSDTKALCSSSLSELVDESEAGDTIKLNADTSVMSRTTLKEGMTLDGQGNTLTSPFAKTSNSNNAALYPADNVTIRNIIIDGTGGTQLHGVNVYQRDNVLIENTTITNYRSGIVVNGSEVTVNNITTAGNSWHGINVDQGGGVTQPAILTVQGVSNQTDSAQIYLDKFATADVTVVDVNNQYESSDNVLKAGDRLYQLKLEPQTVEVSGLVVTHDDAAQNIYVEFAIDNELELTLPSVDQAEIVALYTNLNLALESGNTTQIEAAVNALGDDIITEYYYLDEGGNKVYLDTIGGNPLVKNKYWSRYLVNNDDSQRYPDHGAGVTTIPAGTYRTNTNPLTGSVADGWLDEAAGKDVYVAVTVLSNGEVRTQTESITLPEPPDTIKPEVTITSEVKEFNNQDFSIDVEATDGESGLKRVVINLYDTNGFLAPCVNAAGEGANSKFVSCDIDVSELGDGEFYIKTNARDEADNLSQTKQQVFKIDITDPIVDIDNPENGMIVPGTFDIEGTWEDAFSGINFIRVWINRKVDGSFAGRLINDDRAQISEDGTFRYEVKNAPSGNYDLKINGVDNAGNDDFASNVNVTVDADAPQVSGVTLNGTNVENADLRDANCQEILQTYKVNGDLNLSATLEDEVSGVANARYRIRKLNENGCTMSSVYSSGQTNLEYDSQTDTWSTSEGFDTTVLEDGVYTVMMTIRDNVGNQSVSYVDIEVDNTHPIITEIAYLRDGVEASIFAPGDEMTIQVTTEDENDVTRVQYWARKFPWDGSSQLSSGDLVEVSENVWEKTITVPSSYTNGDDVNEELLGNYVNFRPFDELGNSHIGWRENFTIDATGPETTITGPEDGFNSNEPITITGVTTDPNGVAKVTIEARTEGETEYSISVAQITEFAEDGSWTYTWTPELEGLYDLRAYGEDSLGNLEMTDYIDNLVYDLTAPSVPELISPRNMWIQGKAALTNTWSTVTDNLSNSVTYLYRSERTSESVNPGSVWQGEYGVTSKTAPESAISGMNGHIFTWMVRAVDAAGNMSPWSDSRTVIIDTEAPELTIDPIQTPTYSKTISGTAIDENGIRRVLIHYKKAGERGRGTLVPRTNVTYDDITGKWTAELPIEESGEYEIRVKARDMARPFNESEQQVFNVMLDFAKPEVTWIAPGFQTYSSTNSIEAFVQVNDADSDIESVEFKINRIDGFWGNYVDWVIDYNSMWHEGDGVYSYDFTYLDLPDDIYRLEVRVTDSAGHQTLWPFQEVIIDTSAPEITLEGITQDDGDTFEPGVEIFANEGDILITKDGQEYAYNPETGITDEGEYEIVVRDEAGNETSQQISVKSPISEEEDDTSTDSEEQTEKDDESVQVPNDVPPTNNNLSQEDVSNGEGGNPSDQAQGEVSDDQEEDTQSSDEVNSNTEPSNVLENTITEEVNTESETILAANTPTQVQTESTDAPQDTQEEENVSENAEESGDDESSSDAENVVPEEDNDENGLAANIFGFFGNLFTSWWFWIILLIGGFLLLFPLFRRDNEEDA
jgi:hypothetical protein